MSFFHKKMSQNFWATIMPYELVTLIFYWPKYFFSGQPGPHFRHCQAWYEMDMVRNDYNSSHTVM